MILCKRFYATFGLRFGTKELEFSQSHHPNQAATQARIAIANSSAIHSALVVKKTHPQSVHGSRGNPNWLLLNLLCANSSAFTFSTPLVLMFNVFFINLISKFVMKCNNIPEDFPFVSSYRIAQFQSVWVKDV